MHVRYRRCHDERVDYTLEQVRALVAVADTGHFGRAAQSLSRTQPPLSRAVQKLEAAVGARLLERTPRGAVPTAAGAAFLPHARRLLAEAADAGTAAREAAAGRTGRVRVGFTVLAGLTVLGEHLAPARERLPGVRLELEEADSRAQLAGLAAGTLDLGLVRGLPPGTDLSARLVRSERLVAAVPAAHPLAGRTSVTLTELAAHPLVTHSPDLAPALHRLVDAAFTAVGAHPPVAATANQVHTLLALVDAGVGAAVVPAGVLRLRLDGVRYLELGEGDGHRPERHRAELFRVHQPGPPPALRALLDVLPAGVSRA